MTRLIELNLITPARSEEKPEPDVRYQRCALDGYFDCAAKIPDACFCAQMPKSLLLAKMRKKYGPDWPS